MDVSRLQIFLFEQALPLWADIGIDRVFGGSIEALTLDGRGRHPSNFKRTRVVARQLYVFSHASILGWRDGSEISLGLFSYLREKCWMGTELGWARRTSADGQVSDPTPDLYDYAFALFALGWFYKATKETKALQLAHLTLDLLESQFRHPQGGFYHEIPSLSPRQQNPHMHLFEAALTLAEVSGESRFMSLADEIRYLFVNRLFRSDLSVLPEFYQEDLTPAQGDSGRWVEPGHHMEWAWILAQHQKMSGSNNKDFIQSLMGFAETHGYNAQTGFTLNSVQDDGVTLDGGSRTWPNTERIKGWVALHELFGRPAKSEITASLDTLFSWHLDHPAKGCWQDAFDEKGHPLATTIPASTLYHLFLAFSEVLRVFPPLTTQVKLDG